MLLVCMREAILPLMCMRYQRVAKLQVPPVTTIYDLGRVAHKVHRSAPLEPAKRTWS
jgi:hypothetical protein